MNDYRGYARALDAQSKVLYWIEHNLANYLKKNPENQEEIEHMIDYLVSDESPENMSAMSYADVLKNTNKWTKKLIKKGAHIKESESDVELVVDFKDGFKIVKLIGKSAYEREGYLMRHCVASYYGSGKEIYSLRDKDNMPHCTMEKDNQIKGKGNGNIHPQYVGYVVKFLEHVGMTVGDSEMAHLGYINVEKFKKHLHKDTKYFNRKYVPEDQKLLKKDGNEFASFELLDVKPLIKEDISGGLKINFDLPHFIKAAIEFDSEKSVSEHVQASSGYSSQLASSGDYSQLASSGYSSRLASSGGYSQLASSGGCSRLASSGDSSRLASSGGYSRLASSGGYSRLEMKGENSVGANIGYDGVIKGILGSWITLAEYDNQGVVKYVRSAQIDGKKLKADTWYKLKNKKFTEAQI